MKVDNMREEHNQKVIQQSEMEAAAKEETEKKEEKAPHKDFGFVTISAGEGLSEIFKELGVDEVIEGGQTMNPSTEDILMQILFLFFRIIRTLFLPRSRQQSL